MASIVSAAFRAISTAGLTVRAVLSDPVSNEDARRTFENNPNVIIVNGGLSNKGIQALTFAVVDRIRRMYPDKEFYLFSAADHQRSAEEKSRYRFHVMPWRWDERSGFFLLGKWSAAYEWYRDIVENAACFIDVSGHGLNGRWGFNFTADYLMNIAVARKYSIPFYVFTQSLGPFEHEFPFNGLSRFLLRRYLRYPQKIFAREREGYDDVRQFTEDNVVQTADLVLQTRDYRTANIFQGPVDVRSVEIEPGAVGIVPNIWVDGLMEEGCLVGLYRRLIAMLTRQRRAVYLLRHADEDEGLCRRIASESGYKVRLIEGDFNVIELEGIIRQFDFIVTSRYHSLVNAYKNGVPAVVIGWATRYRELMQTMEQSRYYFDCREGIDRASFDMAVSTMIGQVQAEKQVIGRRMAGIAGVDPFSVFTAATVTTEAVPQKGIG